MSNQKTTEELLAILFELKYERKSTTGGQNYYFEIISKDNIPIVKQAVWNFMLENDTFKHIAELEAKVFVYEQIIKNSNFAPVIKTSSTKTATNKTNN